MSFTALIVPNAIFAQDIEIGIDFDALFVKYEDQVIEFDWGGFQVLSLDGGVRVGRRGQPGNFVYNSSDLSEGGPVGCLFSILISLNAYDRACPEIATEPEKVRMQTALHRVGLFYAENTYPQVSYGVIDESVTLLVNEAAQQYAAPPSVCAAITTNNMFHSFLNGSFEQRLDAVLAVPRLPVQSPCMGETPSYAWETEDLEQK